MSSCLRIGSKVARQIGTWHPNANLYQKEDMIPGTILDSVGKATWHVLWDDGHVDDNLTHPSSVLKYLGCFHEEESPDNTNNTNPPSLPTADTLDSSSDEDIDVNEDINRNEDIIQTAVLDEMTQRIEDYDKEIATAKESMSKLVGEKFKPKTGDLKPVWTVVSNVDSTRLQVIDRQTCFSSLTKKGKVP